MTYKELDNQLLMHPTRLHPASIFFEFTFVIKETIFGFGIGLILTLKESLFLFLIFTSVFLTLLIIYSVLSWFRFTYHVENNELRIEQGVFIRKKRYISIHRIHKIDITANIVHRLFKLVKVQIDTASNSDGAEVYLSAVKLSEADLLRKALKKRTHVTQIEECQQDSSPIREKITWRRLFIAGSTSGSAGVIIIAVLTVFTQIEEMIPKKVFNEAYHWLSELGMFFLIILIIFLLFLLWLFGIAGTMIRYGNFTIEKRGEELFIKRGFLETKELTIPFERIQAVGVEQSIIRQPFGLVRVFAIVAGGSFDKLEAFPVLFPLMHKSEVESFLREFVPEYQGITEGSLKTPPRRALKYYLLSFSSGIILGVTIAIAYYFPTYSWIPLLLLLFRLGFSWLQYRSVGYACDGGRVIFQKRLFQKTTIITYQQRIQAFEKRQHRLQAFENLASVHLSLIGSSGFGTHYALHHLDEEDANELADWYSYRDSGADVSIKR